MTYYKESKLCVDVFRCTCGAWVWQGRPCMTCRALAGRG